MSRSVLVKVLSIMVLLALSVAVVGVLQRCSQSDNDIAPFTAPDSVPSPAAPDPGYTVPSLDGGPTGPPVEGVPMRYWYTIVYREYGNVLPDAPTFQDQVCVPDGFLHIGDAVADIIIVSFYSTGVNCMRES